MEAPRASCERIVEMDAFAEASTIADADFIESFDEMLVVEPYRGAVENQTKSLSELGKMEGDQFPRGSLVSDDLKSVMMVLKLTRHRLPVRSFRKSWIAYLKSSSRKALNGRNCISRALNLIRSRRPSKRASASRRFSDYLVGSVGRGVSSSPILASHCDVGCRYCGYLMDAGFYDILRPRDQSDACDDPWP